ncbi:MAG: SGNH/GDSL hydrolase family protein, partial [Dermatophilaceae bacterium]
MARRRTMSITALVSTTLLLVAPAPAHADPASYVALGDSYSAGTGAGRYLDDGTTCFRSPFGYPSLVATAGGYDLNLRACSGATVVDVKENQLAALTADTDYVTISVGGNDIGFANVFISCGLPSWVSNCYRSIDGARQHLTDTLPDDLRDLYADIRSRAPDARVTVVGYPRLFNGADCHPLTFFTAGEMTELNDASDLLNDLTRTAATDAGFEFASVTAPFLEHAVCDDDPWINGLTLRSIPASFHPNRLGYSAGYALAVGSVPASTADIARAGRSAGELAAEQRQYAAADRSISPELVQAPDLRSARVRAAADRAGVDLSSRASIEGADRIWDERQQRERD